MANRDVLAIGASAGGVETLLYLAKNFSNDFPASILVTIHLARHFRSELDDVLQRVGPISPAFAQGGEKIAKGRMYLAPPDRHLLLDGEMLVLGSGPRENNARPAIDAMLRSAALCCGPRVVGVILTGMLGDGAAGLSALSSAGGVTVVQDPKDALFCDMPSAALERIRPDHIVPLAKMSDLLDQLVRQPAGPAKILPPSLKYEVDVARGRAGNMDAMDKLGRRSALTCPDCGGVMWAIEEEGTARYRCHVGHAYSQEMLAVALDESLRKAFASALRALEERAALARKLSNDAADRGHALVARDWAERSSEAEREAEVIRESINRVHRIDASATARQTAA